MKKAFSLIELSVVILIIGILIAGVTQGSRLVRQSRLSTAQNMTQNSPVHSIPNLATWLETTSEASIIDSEREDGKTVSTWYDINLQSSYKNNATQTTPASRPIFTEGVINNLPVLNFNGSSQFFSLDGTFLTGMPYTIFIVEQRKAAVAYEIILGGTSEVTNSDLLLGYRNSDTSVIQGHYSYDLTYNIGTFSTPTVRMHTFRMSTTNGKNYWLNGGTTADATAAGQTTALLSNAGWMIGKWLTLYYYNGDIAEIIIFTRALKTEERQSVETYLSKKWGIRIS